MSQSRLAPRLVREGRLREVATTYGTKAIAALVDKCISEARAPEDLDLMVQRELMGRVLSVYGTLNTNPAAERATQFVAELPVLFFVSATREIGWCLPR